MPLPSLHVCQNSTGIAEKVAAFSVKPNVWTEYNVPLPRGTYRIVVRAEGQLAVLSLDAIHITTQHAGKDINRDVAVLQL